MQSNFEEDISKMYGMENFSQQTKYLINSMKIPFVRKKNLGCEKVTYKLK